MVNKRKTLTAIQDREKGKRQKSKLQLSNLPTDILCSILSCLPLKEAIRTGVLSTQWKNLWCWYDKLDFSYSTVTSKRDRKRSFSAQGYHKNKRKFINSVNATLRQHNGVGIKQFRVDFTLLSEDAVHIDRWVKFAIKSKAKELILRFPTTRSGPSIVPYDFPFQIIRKKDVYLRHLHLTFVSLRPPADFTCFSDLVMLILEDVRITDEDLQCFLSKCNHLMYLHVAYCGTLGSLRTHDLNQLKHFHVESCPLLKVIEPNRGIIELCYRGPIQRLVLSGCSELASVRINSTCGESVIDSVFNKLPDTLSGLKTLSLRGSEFERACFPANCPKFISLRHLILELALYGDPESHFDVLDIACFLEAAPLMEKFDLHMIMKCYNGRYFEEDGELRSLPPCRHSHLYMVSITGFFGQKDQLELALHILRNAVVLKAMKIVSRVTKFEPGEWYAGLPHYSARGYRVASEFVCKEDHNNVVEILENI